ncbi:MAG: anthranilate phosphoribosyltransferase [Pirellulaceae bacterium]
MTKTTRQRVEAGEPLSMQEMADVVDVIMQGKWSDDEIAQFLTALRRKGETVAEIAGAARALRKHMTPVRAKRTGVVDTCGTGGDGSGTFNISTAAALVTAAAGVPVAKHGNRSITSRTGSADVLAALGVHIEAPVATVERCLEELGICFCFAPQLHPSMKHVAKARMQLGVPTIFNMIGPLCNPASAPFQLLGVGKPHLRPLLSSALGMLGSQRAVVVTGEDGLDEVTLSGVTRVTEVQGENVRHFTWQPDDFGRSVADKTSMLVDGPSTSAQMIRDILAGKTGPARDIVVINAAAAIWTTDTTRSPRHCAEKAATAIDQGAAQDLLARLVEVSNS